MDDTSLELSPAVGASAVRSEFVHRAGNRFDGQSMGVIDVSGNELRSHQCCRTVARLACIRAKRIRPEFRNYLDECV